MNICKSELLYFFLIQISLFVYVLKQNILSVHYDFYRWKNSLICSSMIFIKRVLASTLAHAMCGVINSLLLSLIFASGFSLLIGSSLSTSNPAAAISPFSKASYKSCSTTIGPLPTLMKMADRFILAKASAFIKPNVASVNGACTEIISDFVNKVSQSARS